jgi:predicted CoA-binding protein
MLPIAIERHGPREAAIPGAFQSSVEGGAFAARCLVAQYLGTRAGCGRAGRIRGAVVHYEDRGQMFAYLANDRLDGGRFVQARNYDGTLSGPVHFDCGGVSGDSRRVSRNKCRVLASTAFHTNTGFMKTIAILGASADRQKFGNKAVRAFRQQGYTVYPVNPKETEIEGLTCYGSISDVPVRPQMVSVYLPPPVLLKVLPDIAAKGCDELWLNPGTESDEVLAAIERLSLNGVQACSIVGVGVSPSSL